MQIKEARLRLIIKQTLLKELDKSFRSRGSIASSRAKECPFQVKIPEKFVTLFSSTNIQTLRGKILGMLPDAGLLSKKMDSTIEELDKILPPLMGYINTYTLAIGTSCGVYYLVYKALQIIEGFLVMVGAIGPEKRTTTDNPKAGSSGIDFLLQIKSRSLNMSSGMNSRLFVNTFPFYSLPALSELGPNVDNVDKLKGDLNYNEEMISDISSIRANTEARLFKKITEILKIDDNPDIRDISFPDVALTAGQIEDYKSAATTAIISGVYESLRNYTEPIANNPAFKSAYTDFQRRHS